VSAGGPGRPAVERATRYAATALTAAPSRVSSAVTGRSGRPATCGRSRHTSNASRSAGRRTDVTTTTMGGCTWTGGRCHAGTESALALRCSNLPMRIAPERTSARSQAHPSASKKMEEEGSVAVSIGWCRCIAWHPSRWHASSTAVRESEKIRSDQTSSSDAQCGERETCSCNVR
jgi:hypothetical protein